MADQYTNADLDKIMKEMAKAVGLIADFSKEVRNIPVEKTFEDFEDAEKAFEERQQADEKRRQAKAKNAREDRSRKIESSTREVLGGFKLLGGSSSDAASAFVKLTGFIGGGAFAAAIEGAIQWTGHLTTTYRDLAASGVSFSGGMIEMSQAAALSGQTLDQFAAFAKKNSQIFAQFGQKDVIRMATKVRQLSEEFGMFGYSVEGMNDITSEYLKRQLAFGRTDKDAKDKAQENILDLAGQTAGLSAVFGKSRDQITKDASDVMHNTQYLLTMQSLTQQQIDALGKTIGKAITDLSAVGGKIGPMLADMMAEQTARGDLSQNKYAQELNRVGLHGIVQATAEAQKRIASGEDRSKVEAELAQTTRGLIDSQRGSLRAYEKTNPIVATLIQNYGELGNVTEANLKRAEKEKASGDKLTKQFLAFNNALGRVTGFIKDKALSALGFFAEHLAVVINGLVDTIGPVIKLFGGGDTDSAVKENKRSSEEMSKTTDATSSSIGKFASALGSVGISFGGLALSIVAAITAFKAIKGIGGILLEKLGVKALGASFMEKLGLGGAMKAGVMTVTAGVVNVNGATGTGLGGLGGGAADAAKKAEEAAEHIGGKKGFFGKLAGKVKNLTSGAAGLLSGGGGLKGAAGKLLLAGAAAAAVAAAGKVEANDPNKKDDKPKDDKVAAGGAPVTFRHNDPNGPEANDNDTPDAKPEEKKDEKKPVDPDKPSGFWDTIGKGVTGLSSMLKKTGDVMTGENLGKAGSVGMGALSGAEVGGLMGSFVPVIGNAVGAAVGGVIGGGLAAWNEFGGTANTPSGPVDPTKKDPAAAPTGVIKDPKIEALQAQVDADMQKITENNNNKEMSEMMKFGKNADLAKEIRQLWHAINVQTELMAKQNNKVIDQNSTMIRQGNKS